jgi:hypothetical protein
MWHHGQQFLVLLNLLHANRRHRIETTLEVEFVTPSKGWIKPLKTTVLQDSCSSIRKRTMQTKYALVRATSNTCYSIQEPWVLCLNWRKTLAFPLHETQHGFCRDSLSWPLVGCLQLVLFCRSRITEIETKMIKTWKTAKTQKSKPHSVYFNPLQFYQVSGRIKAACRKLRSQGTSWQGPEVHAAGLLISCYH